MLKLPTAGPVVTEGTAPSARLGLHCVGQKFSLLKTPEDSKKKPPLILTK